MLQLHEPPRQFVARAHSDSRARNARDEAPRKRSDRPCEGRLLLVDDDPVYLETLTGLLEELGFVIDRLDSGEAAVRRFATSGGDLPECVLLDRQMPGLDGERTCIGIRGLHTEVPIIMVTSHNEPDAVVGALAAGADDFVVKGDSVEVLAARVRAQLRRAQQRRELSEMRDLLSAVLTSVPDPIVALDERGVITVTNEAAGALGAAPLGSRFDDWLMRLQLARTGGGETYALSASDLSEAARDHVELVMPDGSGGHRHQLLSVRTFRGLMGSSSGKVAVLRDVTAERMAQRQLQVAERMAALGMVAAGVGHEINNPLAAVSVSLELLEQDQTALSAAQRESLQEVRSGVDRIRDVARELRTMVQEPQHDLSAADVNRVVELSVRMARNEIMHRARLRKSLGEVPLVRGPESRLGQVLLNLLLNAAQAIPSGNADANEIAITTRIDEGGWVAIEVSDTGPGIAKEHMSRLATPFFTTKAASSGTGLGLSICHRIVSELGGRIDVESSTKGATFRVMLPAQGAPLPASRVSVPAPPVEQPRLRLLFVDDNPSILRALARSLGRANEVAAESTARAALERIQGGERFDAIVCDVMMPVMTGLELHRRVAELDAAQADRMVFFTGGLTDPVLAAALAALDNLTLDKPIDLRAVEAAIRKISPPGRK